MDPRGNDPREDTGARNTQVCKHCNKPFTLQEGDVQYVQTAFDKTCKEGTTGLLIKTYVCPANDCRRRTLPATWSVIRDRKMVPPPWVKTDSTRTWSLLPPAHIPAQKPFISTEVYACLCEAHIVAETSPSSAVIQGRICLELLLDARWAETDDELCQRIRGVRYLAKKIAEAADRVTQRTREALDAIREVGNCFTHPAQRELRQITREQAHLVLFGLNEFIAEWEHEVETQKKQEELLELSRAAKAEPGRTAQENKPPEAPAS